jgi:hypothetical protein
MLAIKNISPVIEILAFISMWIIPFIPWLLARCKPKRYPHHIEETEMTASTKTTGKACRLRPVILYLIICVILSVLGFELLDTGEVTRMSVYKIVFCVNAFFFLLIYATLIRFIEAVYSRRDNNK